MKIHFSHDNETALCGISLTSPLIYEGRRVGHRWTNKPYVLLDDNYGLYDRRCQRCLEALKKGEDKR